MDFSPVVLVPVSYFGKSFVSLTVTPAPEPTPTSTTTPAPSVSAEPTPVPTVTVTVTETAAPSGPSTVILDGDQYGGITAGIVLILLLLAAVLTSQMRRP